MSWIKDELAHLQHLAQKWKGEAVTKVETLEADAAPLFKQLQTQLKDESYGIAKTELTTVMTAALSGGGIAAIGAAIAATIPGLITKLELDGNADAKNALYGLAAIVQAQITAA